MGSYPALDVRYQPGPDTGVLHDLLYAELDAFEPLAIHDLDAGDGWRVFFRIASQRDSAQAALVSALGDRLLGTSPVDVDDEDWARRSQAALTAIQVGRIIVAPPWDVPEHRDLGSGIRASGSPNPEARLSSPESPISSPECGLPSPQSRIPRPAIVIVIEPSMGFGTGHHATTRLCLALLQTIELAGMRVIDVGTGSGVLAIAASKLGAASVTAIDNDPDALQNARENIARNAASDPNGDTHLYGKSLMAKAQHSDHQIRVVEADLSAAAGQTANVVVANLTGGVLQRHAAVLRRMVEPAGVLIVSGFSPEEMDDVVGALGMLVLDSRREGEWAAALMRART